MGAVVYEPLAAALDELPSGFPRTPSQLEIQIPEKFFSEEVFALAGLPRDAVKASIESHDGRVTDRVSKNTSYLVVGEALDSKVEEARSLEVKIINEKGLRSPCAA